MEAVKQKINLAYIILHGIYSAAKDRGVVPLLQMTYVAIDDEIRDRKKGFHKSIYLDPRKEAANLASSSAANFYQPIRTKPFVALLKKIKPDSRFNFVDIGSGTGKSLFIAANYGFRVLRGVELLQSLCDVAAKNIEKFKGDHPQSQFSVTCGDALDFPFEHNDGFFLLNDPFYDKVFSAFIDRLIEHRNSCGHDVVMVFKNNGNKNIPSLQRLKRVSIYEEYVFSSNFFEVYRVQGPQ